MTPEDAARPLGEYVLWWPMPESVAAPVCPLCGESDQDSYWWVGGGPFLGLLDRGPLCERCVEDRTPLFIQHWSKAMAELDTAALYCPDVLRPHLVSVVSRLAESIVRRYS